MLNHCTFIGNLGNDPETKQLTNGTTLTNFSVACTEKWKDKQTGERKEKTEWVRCVAFGKLAEICSEYLAKGSKVYVSGKMQTRSWDTDTGEKRYATEVVLSDMKMLGDHGQGQGTQTAQRATQSPQAASAPDFSNMDDDIPF